MDHKILKSVYLKSAQFKLDLASILPVELIPLAYYMEWASPTFRFNRLLRLGRILECRFKIETRIRFPFMFRIIYLIVLIMVIMHWNGCLYFTVSKYIGLILLAYLKAFELHTAEFKYSDRGSFT